MYVGDKNRIDISSDQFAEFIENGNLYVDKTIFVEHVLQDASKVLLFTRPRRMGKSLNLNTLHTFLDCKQDTVSLFKGLYIEKSPMFEQINKHPIIFLDFKNLEPERYRQWFKSCLKRIAKKYLEDHQIEEDLADYFTDKDNYSTNALLFLVQNLHTVLGLKPYIIIDEYDKPLIDSMGTPEFKDLRKWLAALFGSSLKGNASLGKAVLTGVTRLAKENMFSELNNLAVYDVLQRSMYDADFALTEEELLTIEPQIELDMMKLWYDNIRVGAASLFNIYSVMSHLKDMDRKFRGYWTLTGNAKLLGSLMVDSRVQTIVKLMNEDCEPQMVPLNSQLILEHLKNASLCDDESFYTLAVQSGYLSFDRDEFDNYRVFIPNKEILQVWAGIIIFARYHGISNDLHGIFASINNIELFGEKLTKYGNMVLSYNDVGGDHERVYHAFFLGAIHSLGFDCETNQEAGFGRFDILMKTPMYYVLIEFKVAVSQTEKAIETAANKALKQIDEKEYWHKIGDSHLPVYKVGIGCYGKRCLAKAVKH